MPLNRTATPEDELDFLMSFIEASDRSTAHYREQDEEVLRNYFVLPIADKNSDSPWAGGSSKFWDQRVPVLKNPETHQIVETYLSKVLLLTVGDEGFVRASPVGWEDAGAGRTVSSLQERAFTRRGNFRSMYTLAKDALLFGASVGFPYWRYEEGTRLRRRSTVNPMTGVERSFVSPENVILWDDICLNHVGLDMFKPEPGVDTIEKMHFAARMYFISEDEAMGLVRQGRWNKARTLKAIESHHSDRRSNPRRDPGYRASIDRQDDSVMGEQYRPLVAFEGTGIVPYKPRKGGNHRRLTALNGELVESRDSPISISRNAPFFEFVVNPIEGSFRGIPHARVIRYLQDFTDGLLICLARATVKKVESPVIYEKSARPDLARLRAWKGPIQVSNIDGIKELEYNPPLNEGFGLLAGMIEQMRSASGAFDPVQGLGAGSKRLSSAEAQLTYQSALDRTSLLTQLWQREYYPAWGHAILELDQEFITSTDELTRRVGNPGLGERRPRLEDIDGEFDLRYVEVGNRDVKIQFLERAMQVAASVPGAAPNFPWSQAFVEWLRLADLRELEAAVSDPNGVEDYVAMSMLTGGGTNPASGNGNGTMKRSGSALSSHMAGALGPGPQTEEIQ